MIHPPDCTCTTSIGCLLRREGSIQLNTGSATTQRKGRPGSNAEYNGIERAIAGEARKGGTFMPYLTPDGKTIPIREGRALRHKHREIRRRQHDQAVSAGHHH